MKVLALSLLRLGDFFHHVHLLREMQTATYPQQVVHVLCFDDCRIAEALFPEFRFHFICRKDLQYELVEGHRNWLSAVSQLLNRVDEINRENFQGIYNLTHTQFAARLMQLLEAPNKVGLQYQEGRPLMAGQALRYVNDIWSVEREPLLNWIDATAASLGLSEPVVAMARRVPTAKEVWLQPLTSEARKNWPLDSWKQLADRLAVANIKVRVIAGPGEEELLRPFFGQALQVMTFAEIRSKRDDCRLFVSGDTSVLHFAVLEEIPVMGLYLGPANPFKTGPRQWGAAVWWASLDCAPCGHRGACTQNSMRCHEALQVENVELSILANLKEMKVGSRLDSAVAFFGEVQTFGRVHFRRMNVESTGSVFTQCSRAP